MKIINFKGGLGNQMFIYLFYLYLRDNHPKEHLYGAYWSGSLREHSYFQIEKIFDLTLPPHNIVTDIISKTAYWLELHHIVSTEENKHSIFYNGYWLDRKFWKNINPQDIFHFHNLKSLSKENIKYRDIIVKSNSVSIHIRRGDYQQGKNKSNFGDFCTLDYYYAAINKMQTKEKSITFFIFSDDIKWTKENLKINNAVYITGNNGNNSWIDMFLMSLCHHNIIANSTFSYWAAMLNNHKDKTVIYPRRWYKWENPDIFPSTWTSL